MFRILSNSLDCPDSQKQAIMAQFPLSSMIGKFGYPSISKRLRKVRNYMKVYVQQIFRVMRNAYKLKDRGSNLFKKKKSLCEKVFIVKIY